MSDQNENATTEAQNANKIKVLREDRIKYIAAIRNLRHAQEVAMEKAYAIMDKMEVRADELLAAGNAIDAELVRLQRAEVPRDPHAEGVRAYEQERQERLDRAILVVGVWRWDSWPAHTPGFRAFPAGEERWDRSSVASPPPSVLVFRGSRTALLARAVDWEKESEREPVYRNYYLRVAQTLRTASATD